MKFIDAAREVVKTKTAHMIRARKDADREYDMKPLFGGKKKGWVILDLFTAGAVVAITDHVKEETRVLINRLPAVKAAEMCLRCTA